VWDLRCGAAMQRWRAYGPGQGGVSHVCTPPERAPRSGGRRRYSHERGIILSVQHAAALPCRCSTSTVLCSLSRRTASLPAGHRRRTATRALPRCPPSPSARPRSGPPRPVMPPTLRFTRAAPQAPTGRRRRCVSRRRQRVTTQSEDHPSCLRRMPRIMAPVAASGLTYATCSRSLPHRAVKENHRTRRLLAQSLRPGTCYRLSARASVPHTARAAATPSSFDVPRAQWCGVASSIRWLLPRFTSPRLVMTQRRPRRRMG